MYDYIVPSLLDSSLLSRVTSNISLTEEHVELHKIQKELTQKYNIFNSYIIMCSFVFMNP